MEGHLGAATARPKLKTVTTTIKLKPKVRAAWQAAALREHRTLTNMLEVLLLDWCRRHKVDVPADSGPMQASQASRPGRSEGFFQ